MKKNTFLFILFSVFIAFNFAFAWEDCDFGKTNQFKPHHNSFNNIKNIGGANTFNPVNNPTNNFNPVNNPTNNFNPVNNPVNQFSPVVNSGASYGNGSGNTYNNGPINNGPVSGSFNYDAKYEEARQMAVVLSHAINTELQFKQGAHSEINDSRIMSVDDIISLLDTLSYEECKRGKGGEGDVLIIDGLIRPQFHKTTEITFNKTLKELNKSDYRFIGWATGVAGTNEISMENVVYAVGQFGMENGATNAVKVKEGSTEWGDTRGFGFDIGGFVTSVIGGFGSRSIGPGASGTAGINGMKGGSADRGDVKFALFVSNAKLAEVSEIYKEKK